MVDKTLLARILGALTPEHIDSLPSVDESDKDARLERYDRVFVNVRSTADIYPQLDFPFNVFNTPQAFASLEDNAFFDKVNNLNPDTDLPQEAEQVISQFREHLLQLVQSLYAAHPNTKMSYAQEIFNKIKESARAQLAHYESGDERQQQETPRFSAAVADDFFEYEEAIIASYLTGYCGFLCAKLQKQLDDGSPEATRLAAYNVNLLNIFLGTSNVKDLVKSIVVRAREERAREKNAKRYMPIIANAYDIDAQFKLQFHQAAQEQSYIAILKGLNAEHKTTDEASSLLDKYYPLYEKAVIRSYIKKKVLDTTRSDIDTKNFTSVEWKTVLSSVDMSANFRDYKSAKETERNTIQIEKNEILAVVKEIRKLANMLEENTDSRTALHKCADDIEQAACSAYAGNRYLRSVEKEALSQKIVGIKNTAVATLSSAKAKSGILSYVIGTLNDLVTRLSESIKGNVSSKKRSHSKMSAGDTSGEVEMKSISVPNSPAYVENQAKRVLTKLDEVAPPPPASSSLAPTS
jgi:hypothetical protein